MSALRAQGRPRRGVAEVGREKIISRLQSEFRSGSDIELSRKTLAELAGVTPALISYYFPKKEVLFEELSRPVMARYRSDMESIIFGSNSNDRKLRDLVSLLVNLYARDGILLDMYTSVMGKTGQAGNVSLCEVSRMTFILGDFFSGWRGRRAEDSLDAAVLQGAVWGMCRFAARVEAEQAGSKDDDVSPLVARVVKFLSPGGGMSAIL